MQACVACFSQATSCAPAWRGNAAQQPSFALQYRILTVCNLADTVTVALSMRNSSSLVEALPLRETDSSSGVFTARVMHPGLDAAAQGLAPAFVTYADTREDGVKRNVTAHVAFEAPGRLSCSSATSSPGTFGEGDTLTVTVVDLDLDQKSTEADVYDFSREQPPVVMLHGSEDDLEAVSVKETALASGVFTGILESTRNASDHSGKLLTYSAHFVTATYSDSNPKSLSDCFLRLRSVGLVSITPNNVLPHQAFTVTVSDADLNTNVYLSQNAHVNVTDSLGESHDIVLRETGIDSAHFTAALSITLDPSALGLGVQEPSQPTLLFLSGINEVLHVSYNDTSPPGLRTPQRAVRCGERGALMAHPPIVSSLPNAAGARGINITVTDSDLNTDAGSVQEHNDLVTVSAASGSTILRTVTVNLTERSTNSSVFTGFVPSMGKGLVTDAERELGLEYLQGLEASAIVIQYDDPTSSVDDQSVTLQTERRGVLEITQMDTDAGHFGIGESITVILNDKDLDVSKRPDTGLVTVTCSGSASDDREDLTLTETAPASGIFTGVLGTSSSAAATVNDTTLSPVGSGVVVTAQYVDELPLDFERTATIEAGFVGRLTTTPAQVLTSTGALTITLTEPDLNADAASVETYGANLQYLYYRIDDSDLTYLEIVENAVDSAQFVSVAQLPSGGAARPPGSRITVTYKDPDIDGKGAVRSDSQANPSTLILSFGADGGNDAAGGFTLSSAAELWRSPACPSNLKWAGTCGPTPACEDNDLCGTTMASLDVAGEYRLAAGSSLTVTVQDVDQNRDSITAETIQVSVRTAQSESSLAAYGAAQNPYCAEAQDECYQGSAHLGPCTTDGDCPGGSCVARGCFDEVRRQEEEPVLSFQLTETGLNTARFSGVIPTRDTPGINRDGDKVVHVGVGDTMSVTYTDAPSLSNEAGEARTRVVKILKAGRPARLSCPSQILIGGRMTVMLTDPDLVGAATAQVQARVLAGNGRLREDEETLMLRPAAPNDAKGKLFAVLQVKAFSIGMLSLPSAWRAILP